MPRIGIMQGRLSPPEDGRFQSFPRQNWRREFEYANAAGLDAIEWIYDAYGAGENPIESEHGLNEMRELADRHSVGVKSVCADYFMDFPFLRVDEGERDRLVEKLNWLIGHCGALEIERIVIPFVDVSRITNAMEIEEVVKIMRRAAKTAEKHSVELHLETDLAPAQFAELLERLPHDLVKANYDSGNSASHGYDSADEFAAYGARIGSVHIKDRLVGGGTVPLGEGNADLPKVFRGLAELGYDRDFVLQVARGATGDEVAWMQQIRTTVTQYLAAAGIRYAEPTNV